MCTMALYSAAHDDVVQLFEQRLRVITSSDEGIQRIGRLRALRTEIFAAAEDSQDPETRNRLMRMARQIENLPIMRGHRNLYQLAEIPQNSVNEEYDSEEFTDEEYDSEEFTDEEYLLNPNIPVTILKGKKETDTNGCNRRNDNKENHKQGM